MPSIFACGHCVRLHSWFWVNTYSFLLLIFKLPISFSPLACNWKTIILLSLTCLCYSNFITVMARNSSLYEKLIHSCCFFFFRLPSNVKKVFHPIICCALSADLTAFAFGYFSKLGLDPVLGMPETNYLIITILL